MAILDTINAKLTEMLGPFGPLMAILMLGVLLILLVLPAMLQKHDDPLDKLKAASKARDGSGRPEKLRASQGTDKLDKYSSFLEPQDEEEYAAIQLKLLQAGYPGKNAVRTFHFAQFALGVIGLALGAVYAFMNATPDSTTKDMLVWVLFPGGAGYGDPSQRSVDLVKRDLARGYISAETAAKDYNLSAADIADVEAAVAKGDMS